MLLAEGGAADLHGVPPSHSSAAACHRSRAAVDFGDRARAGSKIQRAALGEGRSLSGYSALRGHYNAPRKGLYVSGGR